MINNLKIKREASPNPSDRGEFSLPLRGSWRGFLKSVL